MCLGIAGCIACEACSCACGACKCLGKAMPGKMAAGRVGYVLNFLFFSMIAWILRGYAMPLVDWIPDTKIACGDVKAEQVDRCFSIYTVYRVSFVLAVFHLLMGLIMIGLSSVKDFRYGVQEGGWLWKVLGIAALIIGSLWVPSPFFEGYAWVAMIAAAGFILVQLFLLVDFAHSWAENWIEKYEEDQMEVDGSQKWWYALLSVSVVLYLACIGGTIALYIVFTQDSACQVSTLGITLNIVLAVIVAALSCHPRIQEACPRSGLLQSAIVTAYCTYLVYSALMSQPNIELANGKTAVCNPFWESMMKKDLKGNVSVILGAVITVIAVVYSAIRTASTDWEEGEAASSSRDETRPLTATAAGDDEAESGGRPGMATGDDVDTDPEADGNSVPYHATKFHVIFLLASCYVGMLLNDWSVLSTDGSSQTVAADMGSGSLWVKLISSWICYILYTWTLVGPLVLPGRDWS